MRVLVYLSAFLCLVSTSWGTDVGVTLESLDSVDRKVRVTYIPPPTSIYADPANADTVFCALDAQTAWYKRARVIPMKRIDVARYVVEDELPDSTYHLRIEICVPTDRVPEGIASYQIGPAGGYPWVDSIVDQAKLRELSATLGNDPLLYNYYLWNDYFYPIEVGGKYIVPQERFDSTFALAAAYPRSCLGELWMERHDPSTVPDTAAYRKMITAWRSSWNVDVLTAIARRLLNKRGVLYSPVDALWFLERAEASIVEQIGFRTGENIFSSMGRRDAVAAQMINALDALNRYSDAKELGTRALRNAKGQYGREQIARALESAATNAGDSLLLQEIASLSMPVVKDFAYTTIDGAKGTIREHRGKVVVIVFWFAGCVGCAAEHAALHDLASRYAGKEILFLSVSLNDARTLRNYLSKKPLAFQTIPDGQAICDLNGVTAFPTHVILDKNGNTVLWETGGSSSSVENLEFQIVTLTRK